MNSLTISLKIITPERVTYEGDLGDIASLPPKKILRLTDVFVAHTHMDHFCGFDRLLRVCLGRTAGLRMYGPPGFAAQVSHKLAAYTWNLVERYPADFVLEVWELDGREQAAGVRLRGRARFLAEPLEPRSCPGGVLLDEPAFRVRAAPLGHGIPCLGFAIEETHHVNVWKNRLTALWLPTGPWVKTLKDAVIAGAPDDDYGTMCLAYAGEGMAAGEITKLPASQAELRSRIGATEDRTWPLTERGNAGLFTQMTRLKPGDRAEFFLVLAWHFPNTVRPGTHCGHEYAVRFPDAESVADYVLRDRERLLGDSRKWRETYYDSTLPVWLLDRLHLTSCCLSTGTTQWWSNGRFWAGKASCVVRGPARSLAM